MVADVENKEEDGDEEAEASNKCTSCPTYRI